MTTATIKLASIEAVRKFVDIVRKYDCDIDLASGRYLVDAKSIMGIFSLDLMNPIKLTVHSDDCGELMEELKDYVIGE